MAGGFCTSQNLCYLDKQYSQQFYEYSIEDIDSDGIPEFLLSYKFNGIERNRWDIYSASVEANNGFIGTVMYYDREKGVLFDGYEGYFLQGYKIVNERLQNTFSYYIDDEENGDEYVSHYYHENDSGSRTMVTEKEFKEAISGYFCGNISFTGKELCINNLISDLSIDECCDSISYLETMQAYFGILKYYRRDMSEMINFKFAFVTMDEDEIPEMIAVNDNEVEVFFYENGRISKLSGSVGSDSGSSEIYFFPKKSMFMNSKANCGNYTQEFYSIKDKRMQKILTITKEPVMSVLGNDYKKDIWGNVQYNFYIDDVIVSEKDCENIKEILYRTLDLDNGVGMPDLNFKSFDEIMDGLRMITSLK